MLKITLLLCLVIGSLAIDTYENVAGVEPVPVNVRAKRQFGFSGSGAQAGASSFGGGFGGRPGFGGGFSGSNAGASAGSFGGGFGR